MMSDLKQRTYSGLAEDEAKQALGELLAATGDCERYRAAMVKLGQLLGQKVRCLIGQDQKSLLVSTAEDADFLAKGVENAMSGYPLYAAVFWNNHYALPSGESVAPIVHEYLQPDYQLADTMIVVKSVMSGSCVVRTNILALIESLQLTKIYIVAPVMHKDAQQKLVREFPAEIAEKFEFIWFAQDERRSEAGEVIPGIGGQVYQLLGLDDQPAKTGFMPKKVRTLAFG